MDGYSLRLGHRQVERIRLSLIVEHHFLRCVLVAVEREHAASQVVGHDGLLSQAAHEVHSFAQFVGRLEGYALRGARNAVAAFGEESHVQLWFRHLSSSLAGPGNNALQGVIACLKWSFVDGHDARIQTSVFAKEVGGHLPVVEFFAVNAVVRLFRYVEVEHPSCIGSELVVARVE